MFSFLMTIDLKKGHKLPYTGVVYVHQEDPQSPMETLHCLEKFKEWRNRLTQLPESPIHSDGQVRTTSVPSWLHQKIHHVMCLSQCPVFLPAHSPNTMCICTDPRTALQRMQIAYKGTRAKTHLSRVPSRRTLEIKYTWNPMSTMPVLLPWRKCCIFFHLTLTHPHTWHHFPPLVLNARYQHPDLPEDFDLRKQGWPSLVHYMNWLLNAPVWLVLDRDCCEGEEIVAHYPWGDDDPDPDAKYVPQSFNFNIFYLFQHILGVG